MKAGMRGRMIIIILPVVLTALALSTMTILALSVAAQRDRSATLAFEAARGYAGRFDAQLEARLAIPRTMARFMEANRSADRQEVMDGLKRVLDMNPTIIGADVGYEPEAFDGRDEEYRNAPGHDATGRFLPYWNRLAGSARLDPMVDMDISDWYLIPKRTGRDTILEPFTYEGVLMTSLMCPILRDGEFAGIAGVDISLEQMDREVSAIRVFDSGYAILASAAGRLVSFPDKSRIGAAALADLGPAFGSIAEDASRRNAGRIEGTDPVSGAAALLCYAPIGTAGWTMILVAPSAEMYQDVERLAGSMALVAVASALLVSVAIVVAAGTVARPVVALSAMADAIAGGNLDARAPENQGGELGALARAFNNMTTRLDEAFTEVRLSVAELTRARAAQDALITELEDRNAELARFTYAVSHDLKSPLITIKGFLGYVLKEAECGDTEGLRTDIRRVDEAANRMSLLLDDLLELSRIGRISRPPTYNPLGDLAREAGAMVAGRLEAIGAELIIAPDLPVVFGDKERLRELLQNLIDNAAKFMGDQASPRIEVGADKGPEEPVFYVRDNGTGIDPRYLSRIFGLFEKLDQASSGTGLGLAIVKRIVEVHGGRIWAESGGTGKGSEFRFTLNENAVKAKEGAGNGRADP
ncbi:MAG: HAMP domain-containing protein [Spirochaetes bacterium]|nr:HAMP domain-containing protein [Spirochaetota bacterium]MBU1079967.1 HAMP domain-containing protein [Spirochaetota bacterium]